MTMAEHFLSLLSLTLNKRTAVSQVKEEQKKDIGETDLSWATTIFLFSLRDICPILLQTWAAHPRDIYPITHQSILKM